MTDSTRNTDDFPKFDRTSPARTKMGRLRELFDQMEEAMRAGWPLEAVIRALKDQDLEIGIPTLWNAMSRIRKERKDAAEKGLKNPESTTPKKERVQPMVIDADKATEGNAKKKPSIISPDGYRDPVWRFERDVTKRINLDE
jgi:hypothetical protein